MKRWIWFVLLLAFWITPWRPLVGYLTPVTVLAQERLPVNAALAPPVPLPQTACTSQSPAGQHGITLCWSASVSQTVTGYNVYAATVAGGPYTKVNPTLVTGTAFFFPTATLGGVKEYMVVRSFDGTAESVNSNEVSGTAIGNPPPPTVVLVVS